jgi:hypothetical protein
MLICSSPGCQTTAGCQCGRWHLLPRPYDRLPPTPSPSGTEQALETAKQHIAKLITFWMENPGWEKAANDARAFLAGIPRPSHPDTRQP